MRNYKKIVLGSFLLISIAFALISFYVIKNRIYELCKNPFDVSYDRLDTCQNDTDCILVDFAGCCTNKRAINKRHLNQYNKTSSWQVQTEVDSCENVSCPWYVKEGDLECRVADDGAKRCTNQFNYAEKINIDKCLEKYDFILNSGEPDKDCMPDENCKVTDEFYAIYVGGGGRFEEVMEDSNYMMRDFEGLFPENIEKKVMAVYDPNSCMSCGERFLIRESRGLNDVDVYRFCNFLEKQNGICGDCGRVEKITIE